MVAFKANQLPAFVKSPDPKFRAALFYGPEAEQVSDHAEALTRKLIANGGDIVRIAAGELAEDPGRLQVEAQTMSMFSDNKVIRTSAGANFPAEIVEEILAGPPGAWLVIDAGTLKPAARLRKVFETSPVAAALPCYELGERDMAAFIDSELSASKVRVDSEARAYLVDLFGGNQGRARAELTKLALYAGDGGAVALEDVDAALGDVAQAALNTLCAEAANRNAGAALRQLDRLIAAGQSPQGAIIALGRHFDQLHRLSTSVERGERAAAVLARFRPPLHFRQRDILQAQLRSWPRPRIEGAIARIGRAAQAARRRPDLERALAERLLLAVAR
jgi:DNA polymerase III subunit delta